MPCVFRTKEWEKWKKEQEEKERCFAWKAHCVQTEKWKGCTGNIWLEVLRTEVFLCAPASSKPGAGCRFSRPVYCRTHFIVFESFHWTCGTEYRPYDEMGPEIFSGHSIYFYQSHSLFISQCVFYLNICYYIMRILVFYQQVKKQFKSTRECVICIREWDISVKVTSG